MKTRKVDVRLEDDNGKIIFEKKQFEVPEEWTDRAALICASKYAMTNENGALDIIDRVVSQITEWGIKQGYFDEEARTPESLDFKIKLYNILINQRAAFNSPVWFNVGSDTKTNMASACYILPVEDNMEDIFNHGEHEGMIFAGGSGAGLNISKLRGKGELLSNGGTSSGQIGRAHV